MTFLCVFSPVWGLLVQFYTNCQKKANKHQEIS